MFFASCVLSGCSCFMCFLLLSVCTKLFERVVRLLPSFLLMPLQLSLILSTYERCRREERAGLREVLEKMLFGTLREGKVRGVEVGGEIIKIDGAGRAVVVMVVVMMVVVD